MIEEMTRRKVVIFSFRVFNSLGVSMMLDFQD